MVEEWRTLLYPLGLLSGLAFAARFIIQWLKSEKQGKSVVPKIFWQLSLIGSGLLSLHAFIQVQYHVCLIQSCNIVIAWRNLELMHTSQRSTSLTRIIVRLLSVALFITLAFLIQNFFLGNEQGTWFRVPTAPWQTQTSEPIFWVWHVIGFLGYALFSSRFWIQWWLAEKSHTSTLPLSFWWMSLIGALLSINYFMYIHDLVNMIGPLTGLIPYIRNLMLIYKTKPVSQRIS